MKGSRKEVECVNEGTTFRTSMIWHLPTILSSGSIPDEFYEVIFDKELEEIFLFLSKCFDANYYGFGDEDEDDEIVERWQAEEQILDAFMNNQAEIKRFVAKIECPVFKKYGEGSYSYSWGYYTSRYITFTNIDELIKAGNALEKEMREAAQ